MIQEIYAQSSEALDQLLSYFFEDDEFAALRSRFTQPAIMKMAALSVFLYCHNYNENDVQALKLELKFLEENGILAYAHMER